MIKERLRGASTTSAAIEERLASIIQRQFSRFLQPHYIGALLQCKSNTLVHRTP